MLEFVTYRSEIIDNSDKNLIKNIFEDLLKRDSYYTTIQLLYNTSLHFQNMDYTLCRYSQLSSLYRKAFSPNKKLTIMGGIHSNYHISGSLIDYVTGNKLFIKDTYIRLIDHTTGLILHLLVEPPYISSPYYYIYFPDPKCSKSKYFIPPIFNY